jgi:succinate-acetate transporter protein
MGDKIDFTANPAPLGLLGFAMTTILLNLHNAGLIELSAVILSTGIFMGGLAQIMAGAMEWKKGNTFGTTAFVSYGMFWLILVGILLFPKTGYMTAPTGEEMAAFLALWGVFTVFMFIGTLRTNRAMQAVFLLLAILFMGLAVADYTGNADLKVLAGYIGIATGMAAMYLAMAQVLQESLGHEVLPVFAVSKSARPAEKDAKSSGK